MVRTSRFGVLTAIACALTMRTGAAQTAPTLHQAPSFDPDKMTAITVTGCLEQNPIKEGRTGTTGNATRDMPFILTNANAATESSVEIAIPQGALVASTSRTYRLDAEDSRLAPDVGHRVEIHAPYKNAVGQARTRVSQPRASRMRQGSQ
jgi:hypothetical protein